MPARMSLALLLSIAALLVGPAVYARARGRATLAAVDAFALVAVAGIVFAHILPQSFQLAGWVVVPVALGGLLGPGLLCGSRLFHGRESRAIALPLALLAIALHAMLDGVTLASAQGGGEGARELALAVLIHRVPDGLGIWWLVRPLYGLRAALLLLLGIAVFTVVGFYFGGDLLAPAPAEVLALVQAFLGGSLLHVVLRHPPTATGEEPGRWHAASALGGIAAMLLVFGLGHLHAHGGDHDSTFGHGFLSLALESAPALLLAYLAVGAMHALALDLVKLLRRGSPWGQALRGTLVGLPVPVCSCGVIPLYKSLVERGVPATATMAFLVATPELELAAVMLTLSLLGPEITLARIVAAFALALLVGRVAGATVKPRPATAPAFAAERPPLPERLAGGLRYGFGDMVDSTAPWILVGMALAAALEPLLDPATFASLPQVLEVPLFALLGMPLYVCASGSTPLVAVLLAKGISPGAAIAFLLTGPATNLTTFGVVGRLHGRRAAFVFAGTTALFAVLIGYAVELFLPVTAIELPPLHEHAATPFQWSALALLGALYLASLFRQGVRGFVGQVMAPHSHTEPAEACCGPTSREADDGHGHAHGHAH
jgi:uncharacterized protein